MKKTTLAIVGKPNTGKSTFFNLLASGKKALVYNEPGITRDRIIDWITYDSYAFFLVDTAGLFLENKDSFLKQVKEQILIAISEADAIIFMGDIRNGWNIEDIATLDLLRKSSKKFYLTVNKVDVPQHLQSIDEFYKSGMDKLYPISAAHNTGISELLEDIALDFPIKEEQSPLSSEFCLSIIGKPNAGKSSLFNRFLKENRSLVQEQPFTTRDAISTDLSYKDHRIQLIDTVGVRRKHKIDSSLEKLSILSTFRSIIQSQIVAVVIDILEGITTQDLKIIQLAKEKQKTIMLLLNKCDLLASEQEKIRDIKKTIFLEYPFLKNFPILLTSAKTGEKVFQVIDMALKLYKERQKKINTSDLNKILEFINVRHKPPGVGGKHLKIYYVTQIKDDPPVFSFFVNNASLLTTSYKSFLEKNFYHYFGFQGTPLKFLWKSKRLNKK